MFSHRRLLTVMAIIGCLPAAAICGEVTEHQSVDAHGIKVHAEPSTSLTPKEIKDAFHEPSVIMTEVKRLQGLGLAAAVQAIVEGTAKLAAGHKPTSVVMDEHATKFAAGMRGYTFLDIGDSQRPENVRYRKALFIAACASLSAEARARAASMPAEGAAA